MNREQREKRVADSAERQEEAVTALAVAVMGRLRAEDAKDGARRLRIARTPLRPLFAGEPGAIVLLRSIPGFAALWRKAVPEGYVRLTLDREGAAWALVSCMCGRYPCLRRGALLDCECGRWFFHAGTSIRVKKFEALADEAA